MMLDITVIILTYNEEIHIRRCLDNVSRFAKEIVIVDSYSTDSTLEIAARYSNVTILQNKWPGNQAAQFNWALDNLSISTEWILRLDADEYLTSTLIDELAAKLPLMEKNVSSLSLSRARAFCGRILHHGIVNNIRIIRIFRKGKARYEQRLMDEHLLVLEGDTIELKNQFVDDNRMPIGAFINKHNKYASREAALLLDAEYHLSDTEELPYDHGKEVEKKRGEKMRYARMPLFWRAFGYFIYRYVIKLGFLDGKEGFLWDFLQGWWYRTLVDAKIFEIKRACGSDKTKIIVYLREHYGVEINS
jgi:glycosyltransferase involved in cell wall biosynthesis